MLLLANLIIISIIIIMVIIINIISTFLNTKISKLGNISYKQSL